MTTAIDTMAQHLAAGLPADVRRQILTRVVVVVHAAIDRHTPEGQGRVKLRGHTQHEVSPTGEFGVIRNAHPVASYIAFGTRAHLIVARPGKTLRFEVNGETVFAKKVRHPGTKANNFFARGLEAAQSEIQSVLEGAGATLATWLFGGR